METVVSMWIVYVMMVVSLLAACLPGSNKSQTPPPMKVINSVATTTVAASPVVQPITTQIVVVAEPPSPACTPPISADMAALAAIRRACHRAAPGDQHAPPDDWGVFGQSLRAFLKMHGLSNKEVRDFERRLAVTKTAYFCRECSGWHVKMRGAI